MGPRRQVAPLTPVTCWDTSAPELSLSELGVGKWPAQCTTVYISQGRSWPVPACCLWFRFSQAGSGRPGFSSPPGYPLTRHRPAPGADFSLLFFPGLLSQGGCPLSHVTWGAPGVHSSWERETGQLCLVPGRNLHSKHLCRLPWRRSGFRSWELWLLRKEAGLAGPRQCVNRIHRVWLLVAPSCKHSNPQKKGVTLSMVNMSSTKPKKTKQNKPGGYFCN